jgi:hypothetical protein
MRKVYLPDKSQFLLLAATTERSLEASKMLFTRAAVALAVRPWTFAAHTRAKAKKTLAAT